MIVLIFERIVTDLQSSYALTAKEDFMRYLSFDIEATGLGKDCLMIEFAAIAIDAKEREVRDDLKFHSYITCPSFEELKPALDPWVVENNEKLIEKAHQEGATLEQFKEDLSQFINNPRVKNFFDNKRIVLFGKSINAIDLPFMNRDLGWEWMRQNFSHRTFDFTSYCFGLVDMGLLPKGMESGSKLMDFMGMGDVAHTALEDAINTAKMYFYTLDMIDQEKSEA